jgi:hypothetical protein
MMQAHRVQPCHCPVCRADRLVAHVLWGALYGFAGVGVVVAAWALAVLVMSRG